MAPPSVTCPHADRCGGCALIDLPYSEQLSRKYEAVALAISFYSELGGIKPLLILPAENIEKYRTRAKLVASGRYLGLYEKASHEVVDVPECRVLRPAVARAVDAVRNALPFRFTLLALDVREADSGTLVTLIVPPETQLHEVRAAAEQLIRRYPEILGVSWSLRPRAAPALLGSTPVSLAGRASAPHRLEPGVPFHEAVPGSFVQAHAGQTGRLHMAIEQALETVLGGIRDKRVVDLYAGGGALALRLAARGARVTAVDSFAPGLRELTRSAAQQNLELSVIPLPAEQALASLECPDAVIVNPPRRGLSAVARTALAALRPALTLYVSCEPNRLARDLAHLARLGLGTRSLTPVDMIPLTDAVETLASLVPEAAPALQILYQDERSVAFAKPPHLLLAPTGALHCGSLLARVRELSGLESAVPLHELDAKMSGVCLFAREREKAVTLSRVLAEGQLTYTALVAGIAHKKGRVRQGPTKFGNPPVAEARYHRERVVGTHSLLRVFTEPAGSDWIRQRFAQLGHPVFGDARYGNAAGNRHFEARYGLDRVFMHCSQLELRLEARALAIGCDLPPDLTTVLKQLESAGAP